MGLLAKAVLCFLLIHLSLSSGSGYEQGYENNVEETGIMVRISRQLRRGSGGGGGGGGGSSSSSSSGRSGSGAPSKKTPSTGNNKNKNGGGRVPFAAGAAGGTGIYAAGAASRNNRNNNHSMSAPLISCNRYSVSLLTAVIIAIVEF